MTPRLAVFDLDGTLTESKQPATEEIGALLARLLEKIPAAVMGGGGFLQFEKQLLPAIPAGADLERFYLFPDSAAQCYVYKNRLWLRQYDQAFSNQEKEVVMSALSKALAEVGLSSVPVRIWGERIEDREAAIAFSPLGQQAPLGAREEWHLEHEALRERLRDTLAKYLPDFAVAIGGLTTIDITRKGITKAYGLHQLAEISGVPISEMLYVGDALFPGGNDAVVIETGIKTKSVADPKETAEIVRAIISS